MKLIVGIGNPGPEYDGTRHNIGFSVLDELASRCGAPVTKSRFGGLTGQGILSGTRLFLLKPLTFVNLSGSAVAQALSFYKIEIDSLLVICDDADLEPGRLRMRPEGSSGGHNGLKSIASRLGTTGFPRLRIGIGRSSDRDDLTGHVLGRFKKSELDTVRKAIMLAAEATEVWATSGVEEAMNRYNRILNE